jgi:hypothetical protein
MRVFREINERLFLELPCFEYRVLQLNDGCMNFIDRDGSKKSFNKVDKFIEIEFNKANERGRFCFIQMAREPGFNKIVGIKIEIPQAA